MIASKADYDKWVKKYISLSESEGYPISCKLMKKHNLPDSRYYIKNCPSNIHSWNEFKQWCGFVVPLLLTKESAKKFIYQMQDELKRPLMYDDFRGRGCYKVNIMTINKLWGSLNKMKSELGLEIIQDSMMDKIVTKDRFDETVNLILEYLKSENRNFMTTREFKMHKNWIQYVSMIRACKKYYNMDFSQYLSSLGIMFGNNGRGLVHTFEDGEKTLSQYEYMFSSFLKENGFIYNSDYYRDVKYSTFTSNCTSNVNCDYVLKINDEFIYIEIAGVLDSYKTWYYDDREIISSKSKEQYRLNLTYKESLLKQNNLKYFILFPCDLTSNNLSSIIKSPTYELKKNIESFHQNNIDWKKVRDIGELDFTQDIYKKKVS